MKDFLSGILLSTNRKTKGIHTEEINVNFKKNRKINREVE